MKVLITGFDPFGGESVNPAYEAVKLLPETIAGAEVIKLEIPTVYHKAGEAVEAGIEKYQPDVVICVGQAGGRSSITIEKVAINLAEARIPDNSGEQPMDQPLRPDGENAYFTNLPCKAVVPYMIENGGGSIINISTIGSIVPDLGRLGYVVSKSGVNALTENIAVQYARHNIRCNAVLPGLIATDAALNNMSQEFIDSFLKHVPLNRFGLPTDIANAVLFLASDESSFITGEILSVAGGFAKPSPLYGDNVRG